MTGHHFSLTWKRMGEDDPDDCVGFDGELLVGCIHRIFGDHFRWLMIAKLGNRKGTDRGIAGDREDARRRVKESYSDFRSGVPMSDD